VLLQNFKGWIVGGENGGIKNLWLNVHAKTRKHKGKKIIINVCMEE
jgi:hypothetical protein